MSSRRKPTEYIVTTRTGPDLAIQTGVIETKGTSQVATAAVDMTMNTGGDGKVSVTIKGNPPDVQKTIHAAGASQGPTTAIKQFAGNLPHITACEYSDGEKKIGLVIGSSKKEGGKGVANNIAAAAAAAGVEAPNPAKCKTLQIKSPKNKPAAAHKR